MNAAPDLKNLTTPEKWQLMEDLWENLLQSEPEVGSPSWHGTLLEERARLIDSGGELVIDWEVARRQLLEECP